MDPAPLSVLLYRQTGERDGDFQTFVEKGDIAHWPTWTDVDTTIWKRMGCPQVVTVTVQAGNQMAEVDPEIPEVPGDVE